MVQKELDLYMLFTVMAGQITIHIKCRIIYKRFEKRCCNLSLLLPLFDVGPANLFKNVHQLVKYSMYSTCKLQNLTNELEEKITEIVTTEWR
jgi:hypothetical protein